MTNANADDYAAARQNVFFTANNQTPADGNLTGQCVTLLKWFFQDMCTGFPVPFMARGNAKDVGKTLVSQGLAFEVPYGERSRGDVVCYEYGIYGHIASQLSGGRVFEQNVNWSGVARKVVDGEVVYASRIGSENEAWRSGKNPHVYRLKSYKEGGMQEEKFNSGQLHTLLWHGLTPEIAEKAKTVNFEGYFGAEIGQNVSKAYDTIITSQQWHLLKAEAFPPGGNVPAGRTYLEVDPNKIVTT